MFNLRSVFAFWAIVALFLGSAERAHAQTATGVTIGLPATGVIRDHQDYAGKVLATQINYKDCLNEDFFKFTVNIGTGAVNNGYAVEIWAGTSCDQLPARTQGTGTTTCWKVNGTSANNLVMTLRADVRTMLSGRTGGNSLGGDTGGTGGTGGTDGSGLTGGTDATVGTGGTDGGSGGTSGSGGASANLPTDAPTECTPTSTVVGAQTLTLYFLLVDGANMSAASTTWKGTYKLLAPDPPSGVTAKTGENIAPVSWTGTTNQSDQTIDGYQLYCDPAPGQSGLDEAGLPPPDPNILPTKCPDTTVLTPGARPADKYKCGSSSKTATSANATGLINNVPYNVAVAATDTYRNVGVVSTPPACAIPQPVTGFFEAYRGAGGEGGGGFCSFSRHRRPLLLLTVFGLGLCFVLRRRRAT